MDSDVVNQPVNIVVPVELEQPGAEVANHGLEHVVEKDQASGSADAGNPTEITLPLVIAACVTYRVILSTLPNFHACDNVSF